MWGEHRRIWREERSDVKQCPYKLSKITIFLIEQEDEDDALKEEWRKEKEEECK